MISRFGLSWHKAHELVPGENVDRAVGSLFYFADAPFAICEQLLLRDYLVTIEYKSHEMLPGHGSDKQISFPRWEEIACVEHHS